MLSQLNIKNVALIENAQISFSEGLNVLSGETGSGKSVILDSVNFVLGAKADKSMIRYGEEECFVKAEFMVPETSNAIKELREMDIDSDGEIIISRKYSLSGKNSIKINGNTVSAAMLKKITSNLVDVHGQSEHFFLLNESNQLKTLDGIIGKPILSLKEELSSILSHKKEIESNIQKLGGNDEERARRIDVLKFCIDEIVSADIKENEEDELLLKRNKINNLEKIISAVQEASEALSGEGGALDAVHVAKRSIGSISRLDNDYENVFDRLENLSTEAEDIAETLSDFADSLDFDENEAEEVENRLDTIRNIKRKYGSSVELINKFLKNSQAEYDLLSDCAGQYERLTSDLSKTNKKIYDICRKITTLRKENGSDFCKHVEEELKTLNINSAKFQIEFEDYDISSVDKANGNGLDNLCFMFSANAGEPVKPLGKIISGGEMSRFMLAIKTRLSDTNGISTYIFDEIDAGISGKTAKVVGEKFAKISKQTQVIAVSHLAQIAAMSDSEFLIQKFEENGKTYTKVLELDETAKKQEIVRLLGGSDNEEFALKHAEELIKQAKNYKQSIN